MPRTQPWLAPPRKGHLRAGCRGPMHPFPQDLALEVFLAHWGQGSSLNWPKCFYQLHRANPSEERRPGPWHRLLSSAPPETRRGSKAPREVRDQGRGRKSCLCSYRQPRRNLRTLRPAVQRPTAWPGVRPSREAGHLALGRIPAPESRRRRREPASLKRRLR